MMRKMVLLILVVLNGGQLFSQSIQDTVIINRVNKEFLKYNKIVERYVSTKNNAIQEHKLFKYNFSSINVDDFIYRPYYDSLVLKKEADSTIIKNSLLYVKSDGIEYQMKMYHDRDKYIYDFSGYKDNRLIVKFNWSLNYFSKEDLAKKEAIYYTFKGIDKSSPTYSYSKYNKVANNKLYDLVYSKFIDENGISKEKFYKKDFPLSEDEIFKILPKKIANQAVALMKEKYFERYTLVWDKEGNIVDAQRIGNEKINPFNQDDAKLASKIFEMKLKNKKDDIRIDRVYIDNDSTPLYHIRFNPYTLVVNPKTGDIIKMDFKQNIE